VWPYPGCPKEVEVLKQLKREKEGNPHNHAEEVTILGWDQQYYSEKFKSEIRLNEVL